MIESKALVTPKSTLLVSGGAKGITAECVIRLAEKVPCRFILLGRSPLDDSLPTWALETGDEADLKRSIMEDIQAAGEKATPQVILKEYRRIQSSKEIKNTLSRLQGYGAQAVYVSADITDKKSLQKKLQDPIEMLGPVTGVIHGAGSLADKWIEKKTLADFEAVFGPKIDGLRNILDIIQLDKLELMVLFSSVVGFFGNVGQSDYAIANEILNKTAYQLQHNHPNLKVISFNWGPWESGMVTPELKRAFAQQGVELVSIDSGTQVFVKSLLEGNYDGTQLVVGYLPKRPVDRNSKESNTYQIARRLSRNENPFLEDHVIGGKPVLPATCGSAWMINVCEQISPGYTFSKIEDFKVLKGIVFDDSLADQYIVSVEQEPVGKENQLRFLTTVSSQNERGRTLYHYRQKTILSADLPAAPVFEDQRSINQTTPSSIPGVELYQDGTLFHGPSFQGVQELHWLDESGLQMRVELPQQDQQNQGQFAVLKVNPFLNDAIVQCLLIWTQKIDQAPCLPSSAESIEHYIPLQFGRSYLVDLKIRSHKESAVVGDIQVIDPQSRVCLKINGLEGTISRQLGRFIGVKEKQKDA